MPLKNHSLQRHPFAWYLLVTFGVSWSAWLLQNMRPNPMDISGIILFFLGESGLSSEHSS